MQKSTILRSSISLLFLIVLIALTQAQFNPTCRGKRYMCDTHNEITTPDVCTFLNDTKNKLHLIKPCTDPAKPYCNYTEASFGSPALCSASPFTAELTLPGEGCSANSQCYSGVCSGGRCKGADYNETCVDDRDCETALFCSKSDLRCYYQQQFGQNCTRDNECTNNCACNQGTCVYYYSFDHFLPADNPLACSSGYIQDGACYPGLSSEFKGRPCTSNDECVAYDHEGNLVQHGQCECGFNGGGFTYCSLNEGDPEFQTMKNKFAFIVARGFDCHTNLRFGPCSKIYDDEYLEYQQAVRYFNMYPQIMFNDPCIKTTITSEFWSYMSANRLAVNSLAVLLSIFLPILLFA